MVTAASSAPARWQRALVLLCALLLALGVSMATTHSAQAHALPVRYTPAQNAVLRSSPPQVQIAFNEHVNPDISTIVVVNPSNQEVDNRDSQVSDDGYTMTVSLPLLPAGTYVVFWRTHSADDGHVAAGSYLFHIARADGTVPPLTGALPTGHFPGGAGVASINALSGPTLFGALVRWVALAALTLLLGMMFWAAIVEPRQPRSKEALQHQPDTTQPGRFQAALGRRMATVARNALLVLLCATVLEILAQAVVLDGTLAGAVSLPLLSSILLHSRFGSALGLRLGLCLLGLGVAAVARERDLDRRVSLVASGVFVVVLAVVYEFSGHGGAAPVWWGPTIDLLHILANGIWLGGLFTLALVVLPVLLQRSPEEQRAYLARSIPAFSIPALVAVAFVTLTGPLNATTRLTSVQQIWTTPYGLVLVVKTGLFLVMVAISYHHAFQLRPRLARIQVSASGPASGLPPLDGDGQTREGARTSGAGGSGTASQQDARSPQGPFTANTILNSAVARVLALSRTGEPHADSTSGVLGLRALVPHPHTGSHPDQVGNGGQQQERLAHAITTWLQVEATVGVAVLLCAALLGPLAGSLTPPIAATANFGATGGTQTLTQKADALTVTLTVNPGKFGTNTFTVVVRNPDGTPASGGTVFLVTTMVEMDMGTNTVNLTPASAPGTYTGQGDLFMAGHWDVETVIRTKEDPTHLHRTSFTISVRY